MASGPLVINEVLAATCANVLDDDGEPADFIEIYNPSAETVPLSGWHLTDNAAEPTKWRFPDVELASGAYLVVYASGKDRTTGPLHTNFRLDHLGEYVGLIRPDEQTVSDEFAPGFPQLRADVSYGRESVTWQYRYFSSPTPGGPNGVGFYGFVEDVDMSVPRGFYDAPLTVTLTSPTPGAAIRYTTDGSPPTETTGTPYTGELSITSTTVLRASALKPGYLPSEVSTHTYLFNQSAAIKSLPAISLVADETGTFSVEGLWSDVLARGREAEYPVSFEVIQPEDSSGIQQDAGIRLQGSSYRRRVIGPNPDAKWSFKVYFRDDYDAEEWLNYPLIEGTPVERFKSITLRGGYNDSTNPFIKDELGRRLHQDMGSLVAYGTFANVFINGQLKNNGYYNPVERHEERLFQEKYGSELEWDVVSKWQPSGTPADPPRTHDAPYYFDVRDGDHVDFAAMLDDALANDLSQPAHYQQMASRLDIPQFIDYLILQGYARIRDWPQNNWNAARERSDGELGKWRFYAWDLEFGWGSNELTGSFKVPGTSDTMPICILYHALRVNPDFRQLFADRAQHHLLRDGALTEQNIVQRFEELRAEMAGVLPNMNTYIRDVFAPQRPAIVLDSMVSLGLFTFEGPRLYVNGAPAGSEEWILSGDLLTLDNPHGSGTVYFTLDGSDPRLPGGGVGPGATAYSPGSEIPLTTSVVVKARTLDRGQWSAVSETSFHVNPASAANLAITELSYHPHDAEPELGELEVDADEFEFIELRNISGEPIDLGGVQFTDGVIFDFTGGPVKTLAPGEHVLIVENLAAFESRYGTGHNVAGQYSGRLSNGGEYLRLEDASGGVIAAFAYDDAWPWPERPDGTGSSLERIDPAGLYTDATNWRSSSERGGSPGWIGAGPMARVVGRHVFYNDSHFDGGRAQLDSADLDAVAPDKQALLPGHVATKANYTSYDKGINGIAIDVADLPEGVVPGTGDFEFRTGNDDNPAGWGMAPPPLSIHVYRGDGEEGSDRVMLGWEGASVRGGWLEVTLKATDRTGLAASDLFLFGNAPGESGNSPLNTYVDGADFAGARDHATTPAAIDNPYDYNRDGRVDGQDMDLVVAESTNLANCLKLLDLTGYVPLSSAVELAPSSVVGMAQDAVAGLSTELVSIDPAAASAGETGRVGPPAGADPATTRRVRACRHARISPLRLCTAGQASSGTRRETVAAAHDAVLAQVAHEADAGVRTGKRIVSRIRYPGPGGRGWSEAKPREVIPLQVLNLPAEAWAWLCEFDSGRPNGRKPNKDSAHQAAVAQVLAMLGE